MVSRKDIAKALKIPLSAVKESNPNSVTIEIVFLSCLTTNPTENQDLKNLSNSISYHSEMRFNPINRTLSVLVTTFSNHILTTLNHLEKTFTQAGSTYTFSPYIKMGNRLKPLPVENMQFLDHKLHEELNRRKS